MTKTRLSAIAVAAAFAMAFTLSAPASAQLITASDQPAEFPPASYTGRQYVDSTGCVFVRAGFGGAVSWVPRISRSRTKLCGFTPTSVARTELPVIADAPGTPPPTETPQRVVVRAPAAAAPAPRIVAAAPRVATPAPRVVRAPAPVVQVAPRIQVAAPAPVATTAAVRNVRGTCPGASAISAQYINPGARCGPQAEHPAGGVRPLLSGGGGTAFGVSLPHVAPAPLVVPKGYREAWTDGRLNPDRGKQTLSGALQTALIWTQEVPRRLVDNSTGRDVTRDYNYLVYPYTDYAKQRRDLSGGQHIVVRTTSGQRMVVLKSQLSVSKSTGQTILTTGVTPTYSTKSVRAPAAQVAQPPKQAAARVAPKATTGRFVQVGSFGVASNAQSTAARLERAGLQVRIAQVNRGGKTLQIVMAGPFADAGQAQNALGIVRRSGFGDAFLRN